MTILLCDFSSSYIDGEEASIVAAADYRHPDKDERSIPTICAEIHALGSTLYEIIIRTGPYHGLKEDAIDKLLEEGKYPDVSEVLLGEVIQKCWNGGYDSAFEVAEDIRTYRTSSY
jgi:hypothetical protein